MKKFREFRPTIDSTFDKPANAGRKPGYRHRQRHVAPPVLVEDRLESINQQTLEEQIINQGSSSSQAESTVRQSTTVADQVPFLSENPLEDTTTTPPSSQTGVQTSCQSISFHDPRIQDEKEFELHVRNMLDKKISRCHGKCGKPIATSDVMLIRSYGTTVSRNMVPNIFTSRMNV